MRDHDHRADGQIWIGPDIQQFLTQVILPLACNGT
jgi:hypothetical protein